MNFMERTTTTILCRVSEVALAELISIYSDGVYECSGGTGPFSLLDRLAEDYGELAGSCHQMFVVI